MPMLCASDIIDFNIHETKSAKNFSKYSTIIENLFTLANCDDLLVFYFRRNLIFH